MVRKNFFNWKLVKDIVITSKKSGVLTLNSEGMVKFELRDSKIFTREIVNQGKYENFVVFPKLKISYFFEKNNRSVFLLDKNDYVHYVCCVKCKNIENDIIKINEERSLLGLKKKDTLIQIFKISEGNLKKPELAWNFEFRVEGTNVFKKIIDFEIVDHQAIIALDEDRKLIFAKKGDILDLVPLKLDTISKMFLNTSQTELYILGKRKLDSDDFEVLKFKIHQNWMEAQPAYKLGEHKFDMLKNTQFVEINNEVVLLVNSVNLENFSNKIFFIAFEMNSTSIIKTYCPEVFSKTAVYSRDRLWTVGINSLLYKTKFKF